MSSQPVRVLLMLYLAAAAVRAEQLPAIPGSSRILDLEQVKNFWVNTLSRKPIPSKPTGLHPEQQAAWQRALDDRHATIRSVMSGWREEEARLAMLSHNATAWRMQGNEMAAQNAEAELRRWQQHHSIMDTLQMVRRAAQSEIDARERCEADCRH